MHLPENIVPVLLDEVHLHTFDADFLTHMSYFVKVLLARTVTGFISLIPVMHVDTDKLVA